LVTDARVLERTNILYAGTHAVSGHARAIVIATGIDTELGKIAKLSEAPSSEETPLEKKIAQFGKHVLVIAAVVLVSMLSAGLLRGIAFGEILIIAISQIVGLIPEGLPIAVTVAHAVAVQRMAKRKALTRKLSALEALGSVDVICTDKTGTLTENEMTVRSIRMLDRLAIDVTGVGYDPVGGFFEKDQKIDPTTDAQLQKLLLAASLCNDAQLNRRDDAWRSVGDPTEIALLTVAKKAGVNIEALPRRYPRTGELPFDSAIKMMGTSHSDGGESFVALKGAPESILALCRFGLGKHGIDELPDPKRDELMQTVDALAKRALRVIAVAMVDHACIDERTSFESFRSRAIFLGFLAQIDPPRAEAKESIKKCSSAGIKPVMVTGDHKETGRAIAQELGLIGDAIDGEELEKISDEELKYHIDRISVFARVLPAQKLRIVNAFKARDNVVAMTGDGVNDAPALVRADVGVAMGGSGTEVAKEAAKIVITDDNFATIVSAIEQGRVVYQNIQKAILLLISTAAAETLILFLAIAFGYPPPFTAVQILWINLVTETAIVLNLVMDPPEGNEMSTPPIPRLHGLVPTRLMVRIAGMTAAIVASSLGWFIYRIEHDIPVIQAQTEAFTMLVVCDWFNVLNCRSRLRSIFSLSIFKNAWLVTGLSVAIILQGAVLYWRPLGKLFHTVPISWATARSMLVIALLVVVVEESRKFFIRLYDRRRTQP
jgi:magnesium-transporting ATPase (P-type)